MTASADLFDLNRLNVLLGDEYGMDFPAIISLVSEKDPWKLCLHCHALIETAATSLLLELHHATEGSEKAEVLARLSYRVKVTLAFGQSAKAERAGIGHLFPGFLAVGAARNRRAHNIRKFQLPFESREVDDMLRPLHKWLRASALVGSEDPQAKGRIAMVVLALFAAFWAMTHKDALKTKRTQRIIRNAILNRT